MINLEALEGRILSLEKALAKYQAAGETHSENIDGKLKEITQQAEESRQASQTASKALEEANSKFDEFLEFRDHLAKWQDEFQNLRTAYEEQLHLEGPAQMWQDLADRYRRQSMLSLIASAAITASLIAITLMVAYQPPAVLLGDPGINFGYQQIKTAILLATGLSFGAYLLRSLVKLTFSTFHLQRDAVERYQLTRVYLALIRQGASDAPDREIILQALFSRADTGLLSSDSGPTMPGGQLSQLLGSDRRS